MNARHRLLAAVVSLAGGVLMAWNTARWTAHTDYADLAAHRRLWSDLADSTNAYLDHRFPSDAVAQGDAAGVYRMVLLERIARGGMRPWQPWRTIGPRAFLPTRTRTPPGLYDDAGRAVLLGAGFRVLRGVSPFLILWLGFLVCVPLLAWAVGELFAAGRGVAAAVFALGLACWPFFVETLALTRYAVGFYLLALLALVPLSVYAVAGTPTRRGLLWRTGAAGVVLALCALCRPSALMVAAGFAVALAVGLRRLGPLRSRVALATAAGLALLLLGPFLLVKPPRGHGVWSAVWEGLGDFDREKGHAWSDPVAEEVSRANGGGPLWTAGSEAVFRTLVMRDIGQDPAWYAAILAKRVGATATQWKLWPWARRDGTSIARSTSSNEGFMDKYYGYATTADHVGLGPWRVELPASAVALAALALAIGIALRRRSAQAGAPRVRESVAVLGSLALAALPVPVLISTAAAQETQGFALVYVLALALLVDHLIGSWRGRTDWSPS
jgi:hypothetical protein